MIIDTHCHLDFPEFREDLEAVINRAGKAGVNRFINVASSVEGSRNGLLLSKRFNNIFHSIGIHPHYADGTTNTEIEELKTLIDFKSGTVAIGEIGLDYFKDFSSKKNQIELFKKFMEIKQEFGLPVIIHSRNAEDDTLGIIKDVLGANVNGVMHCFTQDKGHLRKVLNMGMHISFTCNVTYKNAGILRETASFVPLDRLLLETDAPFLAPQPLRGKRNEPANLVYLVEALSGIFKIPASDIEDATTSNAEKLFNIRT